MGGQGKAGAGSLPRVHTARQAQKVTWVLFCATGRMSARQQRDPVCVGQGSLWPLWENRAEGTEQRWQRLLQSSR